MDSRKQQQHKLQQQAMAAAVTDNNDIPKERQRHRGKKHAKKKPEHEGKFSYEKCAGLVNCFQIVASVLFGVVYAFLVECDLFPTAQVPT